MFESQPSILAAGDASQCDLSLFSVSASSLHRSSASVSDILSLRTRAGVYDSQDDAKAGMPELDARIDLQSSLPMFDSQHASFSLFHQLRVRIVGHREPVEHPGYLVSISFCNSTLTAYSFPRI
jgi:hypothetical protein